jgi:phage repressor protein C with HTH and peptisase S24 domain
MDQTTASGQSVDQVICKHFEPSFGENGGSLFSVIPSGKSVILPRRELDDRGIEHNDIACATQEDSSMSPNIWPGSIVAYNRRKGALSELTDGHMYAVISGGQIKFRFISCSPDSLILKSMNPSEFEDERYAYDEMHETIKILGKVFWCSSFL